MERFPDEFISWHHNTPVGIKVDEVFGMDSKSGRTWIELARQIFCEQGQNYRSINHFENGAPFIEGLQARISLTHARHFLAVARLPKTPDIDLAIFNPRSAMGIDAERIDRVQVLKIRDKFLTTEEQSLISSEDIKKNVLAWTIKEAVYKAGMTSGIDFRNQIIIRKLPEIDFSPEIIKIPELGEASLTLTMENSNNVFDFLLYSYESYGCVVTIAFSPKCAKYKSVNKS